MESPVEVEGKEKPDHSRPPVWPQESNPFIDSNPSSDPAVTIHVKFDAEEHEFSVHTYILCQESPVLDAVLNTDPQHDIKELYFEGNPVTFSRIIGWMHTKKISGIEDQLPFFGDLIELWMTASILLMPKLQNDAMRLMADKSRLPRPPPDWEIPLDYIYENTEPGSPLRRLLVTYALSGDRFRRIASFEGLPCEMLVDMLEMISEQASAETNIAIHPWKTYLVDEENPIIQGPNAMTTIDPSRR